MSLPAERLERRQRSYATYKQRILAGLSEAQRGWERETGARLVVSETPPYFSYVREDSTGTKRPAA